MNNLQNNRLFDESLYNHKQEEKPIQDIDPELKKKEKRRKQNKNNTSLSFTGLNLLSYYTLFSPICNPDYADPNYVDFKISETLPDNTYPWNQALSNISNRFRIGDCSALGFIMLCIHPKFGQFKLQDGNLIRTQESNQFDLQTIQNKIYQRFRSAPSIPHKYKKMDIQEGYTNYCKEKALKIDKSYFNDKYY
jgi:hypothetical protein